MSFFFFFNGSTTTTTSAPPPPVVATGVPTVTFVFAIVLVVLGFSCVFCFLCYLRHTHEEQKATFAAINADDGEAYYFNVNVLKAAEEAEAEMMRAQKSLDKLHQVVSKSGLALSADRLTQVASNNPLEKHRQQKHTELRSEHHRREEKRRQIVEQRSSRNDADEDYSGAFRNQQRSNSNRGGGRRDHDDDDETYAAGSTARNDSPPKSFLSPSNSAATHQNPFASGRRSLPSSRSFDQDDDEFL